ncbi:MAG: transglutaminase domain-containing protein [Bacillota bacterium]
MKANIKKIAVFAFMAFTLIISVAFLPVPADAASAAVFNDSYEKTIDLKILGLVANSPGNFDLDRAPNRIEGAVMLIRLLGKEKQVKQGNYSHPFTDVPSWAKNYVGYMYENKLTKGVGNNRFGSYEPVTARQFVTFVLRSAGYEENRDFTFDKVMDKAKEISLLSEAEISALDKQGVFLRKEMFAISYGALSIKLKGTSLTLLDKLVSDNFIFKPAAKALGLYTYDIAAELGNPEKYDKPLTKNGYVAENSEDLFRLLRRSLYLFEESVNIDISRYNGSATNDFEGALNRALQVVTEITGVNNFADSWKWSLRSDSPSLKVTLSYRYSKNEYNRRKKNVTEALNKARHIVAGSISADMSDFQKEKILHDYIVNNTRYDYENYLNNTLSDESFEEYGCLVLGVAVCQGYSEAMKLLCDLSGIECMIVGGETNNEGRWESHSWNIVKIDGSYYHLDVTNDDPIMADGSNVLKYDYFNLSDDEMAIENRWDRSKYPACRSLKGGYHHMNGLIAENKKEFEQKVAEAISNRKPAIELKVLDYSKTRYSDTSIRNTIIKSGAVSKYSIMIHNKLGVIRIFNITYS